MKLEEKHVNISVCKSNIKSNGAYFGRVCKNGKVGGEALLQELKKVAPYIEVNMMQAGLEKLVSIIFEFVTSGIDVDFFNLGTFSLATQGKLKIKDGFSSIPLQNGEINECCNYDISESVEKNVQFNLKFIPSTSTKNNLKNVKMHLAIKKDRAPLIQKVSAPIPQRQISSSLSPAFIQIKGEGLKVAGDEAKVGVYIEEKITGDYANSAIKIAKTSILRNEPKNLLIMVEEGLKLGCTYNIKLITQYREGGISQILRVGQCDFVYQCKECSTIQSGAVTSQCADNLQYTNVLSTKSADSALKYKAQGMSQCKESIFQDADNLQYKDASNIQGKDNVAQYTSDDIALHNKINGDSFKLKVADATKHKKKKCKTRMASIFQLKSKSIQAKRKKVA